MKPAPKKRRYGATNKGGLFLHTGPDKPDRVNSRGIDGG